MRGAMLRALLFSVVGSACGSGGERPSAAPGSSPQTAASTVTVHDTTIAATIEAAGVAEPIERAVLGTKLMGTVTAVEVREGDRVSAGQILAQIDAREIEAKRLQVEASLGAAEAGYEDALIQAQRFRALYTDSAATRYQLEQAEVGLVRAQAGLETARGAKAELDAVGAYSEVRAPFSGIVTRRYVDPGAFAAPGTPLLEVQDASRLRLAVTMTPNGAMDLRRGTRLRATIEGRDAEAVVEGVVPIAGSLATVNAMVDNRQGRYPVGGAATLQVPRGSRRVILIPATALIEEGDLIGVQVRTLEGTGVRWVRAGGRHGEMVEILAGLRVDDVIVVPSIPEKD